MPTPHRRGFKLPLCIFCLAFLLALLPTAPLPAAPQVAPQEAEMAGYLLVPNEKVAPEYDAGFSMYVAAWPLLKTYPGHRYQTGLFGTWMFAQHDKANGNAPKFYSDVEGGLGWWRDTRFPTEYPKFIMGGVGPDFSEIANGPAHGAGSWKQPRGLYGVAQLSPWLLFPIDGLNLEQGTCGEMFGYGYVPLPLIAAKKTTAGKDVPTGDNCWTLFLNTANFKGPVAFFTPYFWSHGSVVKPALAGLLLDSRPNEADRTVQMETQYVPAVQATDSKGETYARIAPVTFPRDAHGDSLLVHQIMAYNRKALWDPVKAWFDGGAPASGAIDPQAGAMHTFKGNGGSTWEIYLPNTPREKKTAVDWKSYATPFAPEPATYGYRWNAEKVTKDDAPPGPLVTLPHYFHLVTPAGSDKGDKNAKAGKAKPRWEPVRAEDVPAETGLAQYRFDRPHEHPEKPYDTPDDPAGCWKKPGPAAGPFRAKLGDGSVVTYSWYRFAAQPAMLNADLTDQERQAVQEKVEKLHRAWKKDRDYLPPPKVGKLAELDPAQIVTPPPGLEVGYVPIATRQEMER